MKIRCINEFISSENSSQTLIDWVNNSELEITLGKIYTVLAISKYMDIIFYYIISDLSDFYPLAFPSNLFQIEDNHISQYWQTSLRQIDSLNQINIENGEVISFKEWVLNGDKFYENLLEESKEEVKIFDYYKNKILNEVWE